MGRHVAVLLTVLALVGVACGDDSASAPTTTLDPSVELDGYGCEATEPVVPEQLEIGVELELPDNGNDHVVCPTYEQRPPSSGAHFDAWQNCGFYAAPVQDKTAVHALEHGAVWIAYAPDLAADELAAIEARVEGETHLLAAPYPGLQNAIVLTAWTRQLAVDRVADPLFEQFIDTYLARKSPTAPEAGVSCGGAIGTAPDQPDAGFADILDQVQGS